MSTVKIAILHFSAPPTIGGVEAVIEAHTQEFLKAGYPVTIIAGRGDPSVLPQGARFVHVPEVDSQDERILQISDDLEMGSVSGALEETSLALFGKLKPILEAYDRVIVHNIFTKHFNLPLTAALHRMIGLSAGQRWIAWCHDFSWTSPGSRAKIRPGYPWDLLREYRPDLTYVTVSKHRQIELAELLGCPPEKIRVIYNGVDPYTVLGISQETMPIVKDLQLLEGRPFLLMPVRVTKAKHLEFAIQVVAALKKLDLNPRLVVVGPPDPHSDESLAYFRSLQALRDEHGLSDEFHFLYERSSSRGEPTILDNRGVGDLYRLADIILMPSYREGFGMPVLEAGLAGAKVFSTAIPASEEIGAEDVIVFGEDDPPEKVAEQIVHWMENSHEYHFRQRIRQQYTWDAIFRRSIEPLIWM